MLSISCKLFGYPMIMENDKEVCMPIGKVGAVFYYILIKKNCEP